jgi:hypothetical protein
MLRFQCHGVTSDVKIPTPLTYDVRIPTPLTSDITIPTPPTSDITISTPLTSDITIPTPLTSDVTIPTPLMLLLIKLLGIQRRFSITLWRLPPNFSTNIYLYVFAS